MPSPPSEAAGGVAAARGPAAPGSAAPHVGLVKTEYVEPFVSAAFYVLEQVARARCERGPLSLRQYSTFTTQELTVVVGVMGEIEGVSLYGMSFMTALKIAGMMLGQELVQLDDLALSAVTELANMMSGHATTLLEQASVTCEITPPTVIRGVGTEVTVAGPTLMVPVSTDLGNLSIDISLRVPAEPRVRR